MIGNKKLLLSYGYVYVHPCCGTFVTTHGTRQNQRYHMVEQAHTYTHSQKYMCIC